MPKLSSVSIPVFLKKLGSAEPAPGGGAAAAVVIAQAAGLTEMVARLNHKRNGGPAGRITAVSKIPPALLALLDKDVRAFFQLSRFKKEDRSGARYAKALQSAALVPFAMCRLAHQGAQAAFPEMKRTSRWLYSDLLEAAIFYEAGFRGARLNVEINLSFMKKSAFKSRLSSGLDRMERDIRSIRQKIEKGRP